MIAHRSNSWYECITVDLNTQHDFCARNGRHPVRNCEQLIPALRRLIAWTKRNGVPVISSIDTHRSSEFQKTNIPLCCLDGSPGQQKLNFTIFPRRTGIEFDNTLSVSLDLFRTYQQLIFRKRTDDLLNNPKADRLLTQIPTDEFIVFGNTTERSVKVLTLGLLARAKRVTVVVDACGYWNKTDAELAVRQMQTKGAHFISVDELLKRKLPHRSRYRSGSEPARNEKSPQSNGKHNGKHNGKSQEKDNGRVFPDHGCAPGAGKPQPRTNQPLT